MNVMVGDFYLDNSLPFVLIAGPCVMESYDHSMKMAQEIFDITKEKGVELIFKTSFDKANRTSLFSPRGLGLPEALSVFDSLADDGHTVITDVHSVADIEAVKGIVAALQIPALLARQTDLLMAAGQTGLPVNIKRGPTMDAEAMQEAYSKVAHVSKNNKVLFTERGSIFGPNLFIPDLTLICDLKEYERPVIFDATHSIQRPGLMGGKSGGDRRYTPSLAKAAVAMGVAGIYIEVHDDPDKALSDGSIMMNIKELPDLLDELVEIDRVVKSRRKPI